MRSGTHPLPGWKLAERGGRRPPAGRRPRRVSLLVVAGRNRAADVVRRELAEHEAARVSGRHDGTVDRVAGEVETDGVVRQLDGAVERVAVAVERRRLADERGTD